MEITPHIEDIAAVTAAGILILGLWMVIDPASTLAWWEVVR